MEVIISYYALNGIPPVLEHLLAFRRGGITMGKPNDIQSEMVSELVPTVFILLMVHTTSASHHQHINTVSIIFANAEWHIWDAASSCFGIISSQRLQCKQLYHIQTLQYELPIISSQVIYPSSVLSSSTHHQFSAHLPIISSQLPIISSQLIYPSSVLRSSTHHQFSAHLPIISSQLILMSKHNLSSMFLKSWMT